MSVSKIITGLQMLQAVEQMLAMAKEVDKMNLEKEQRRQMLTDYMNEQGIVAMIANDFPASDFKRRMEAKGLPCVSARVIQGNNVGESMCWVRQEDIEKAKLCLDEISQERMKFGSARVGAAELSLASIQKLGTKDGKNVAIKNLSEEEMTALLPELTAKRLNFGRHDNQDGTFNVYVEVDDKDGEKYHAIQEAVKKYKVAMLNPEYAKNLTQYKKDEQIAMNRFEKVNDDVFFVADRKNPKHIISVRDNQFQNVYYDNENDKQYVDKNVVANENLSLRSEYKYAVSSMIDPVVISTDKVNTIAEAYHHALRLRNADVSKTSRFYDYAKANADTSFTREDMEDACGKMNDSLWNQIQASLEKIRKDDNSLSLETIPKRIMQKNIDDYIADALESTTFSGREMERQEITVEI